jgi:hypothetical protein
MRAVVFDSNSRGACLQYAFSPSAAIERGCSIGANHAQNRHLTGPSDTRRDRTIPDNPSTFRQALHASFS